MNKSIFKTMQEEYHDIKKIVEGDFSEIEELENNPAVQRYKKLLGLKDSRFEFRNENDITGYLLSKYGQGVIQETNHIWFFIYELSLQKYEEFFHSSFKEGDRDSTVLVYFDLENSQKYIAINKEKQKDFESTHQVIVGKSSIEDGFDRYYNARHEFFDLCLKDEQDVVVQKILTKYSKTKV